ncbi:MAG: hypothetical protein CL578_06185 [Alteromonadaceae bacterium]|uniref:hypothetical protein n=1 Tax=uncultured Paraglaciecola sp. TaxID=1765024 RepID=UPI000C654489|nr:hypothetical protein [Alteromonadaceae bacterium]|tara:strand:- start:34708 stop:35346 length:639 start_codon:yes stop_codon:yes gene_type:complete
MINVFKSKITYISFGLLLLGASIIYFLKPITQWFDLMYTPNAPAAVANDFWKIVLSEDELSASRFALKPDTFTEVIKGFSENDRVKFKSESQDGQAYFIKTNITLYRDTVHAFPLYTVIKSKGGEFKVDVEATLLSLPDAMLEDVTRYYQTTSTSAQGWLVAGNKSDKDALSAFSASQIKTTLCNMSDDLSQIATGEIVTIFSECFFQSKVE